MLHTQEVGGSKPPAPTTVLSLRTFGRLRAPGRLCELSADTLAKEVQVSDRLKQSLMASRAEIEAGLAEAEAELARVRQRARELEELIALGTATLLAAEMISGGSKATVSAFPTSSHPTASSPSAAELAAAHERSKEDLQQRLAKQK